MNTVVVTLMPFVFALILVNANDLPGSHLDPHDPSQEKSLHPHRKANKSASIVYTSNESPSVVKVKHTSVSDKKDKSNKKLTTKDQFISATNNPRILPTTSKNSLISPNTMEILDRKENIKENRNGSKPSQKLNIKGQTYNAKPKAKIKEIEQQVDTIKTNKTVTDGLKQENNNHITQAIVTVTDNKDFDNLSSESFHINKTSFINNLIEQKDENKKQVTNSTDENSLFKERILNISGNKVATSATNATKLSGGRTLTANIHGMDTPKRPLETAERSSKSKNVKPKEEANISNKTVKQTDVLSTSQTLPSVVTTFLSSTLTRQSSQSTKLTNSKSSIILSVVSSTSSTIKQDHEPFSRGSSEKCTFLRNDNLEYTRSSVIAAAIGGMTFGGVIVFFLFYARGRCKRYVQGDYRRVPMEYDFELNPRFKTH